MSLASVARRIAARGTSVPIARAVDLVTIPRRHMAEAPKKGGAKPKKAASLPYSVEQGVTLRLDEFQIIKGAPKIVEKPDSEYPEWLWTVHQPLITLDELRKIGFDGMTDMQKKRYFRLLRRQLIKTNNASRSK